MTDRKQGFSLRKLFPGFNRRVEEIRLRYDFAPERVKELTRDPRVPAPDKLRACGLTPFRRSGRYASRPVARGGGQGDWSDHDEQ